MYTKNISSVFSGNKHKFLLKPRQCNSIYCRRTQAKKKRKYPISIYRACLAIFNNFDEVSSLSIFSPFRNENFECNLLSRIYNLRLFIKWERVNL